MKKSFVLLAAIAAGSVAGIANAQQRVSLELSLLVDVSGSIDTAEYNLQKNSYAQVFSNPNFYRDCVNGGDANGNRRIAVNFVEWSGATQQAETVGWSIIGSQADANAFAAAVSGAARAFNGSTAPGSAINFAFPRIFSNGIDSDRQVIDVSGDGEQNDGANTAAARDAALAAGVDQINGLVIGGAALQTWYDANVVGGAGGFSLRANTFAEFAAAIDRKICIEILQGVPLPSAAGMGIACMGLAAARRRRAR